MKSLKRFVAIVMALAVVLSTLTCASATDNPSVVTANSNDGGVYIKVTGNVAYFDGFDNAWKGTITDQEFSFLSTTYNQAFVENNRFIDDFDDLFTDDYLYIFKTAQNVTSDLSVKKDIQIQAAHSLAWQAGPQEAITHTFSGTITVEEGGSLSFVNGYANESWPNQITITFSNPIVVENGGKLSLNSANPDLGNGSSDYGNEDIFKLSESATGPLIQVNNGGSAVLIGVALETDGSQSAVEVNGELTLQEKVTHDLSITSTGNAPAISVGEGGTLKLEGPERSKYTISSSCNGVPAIAVASGGTIEIPNSSNIAITAEENSAQAICLGEGAIVKKDTTEITVGNDDGDNYVDNYGNIILVAGATVDKEELNAAVILSDGTIIEGTEDTAPTVGTSTDRDTGTTTTTVTVPAGGSVQKPNEEKQTLAAGGSVSSTEGETEVTETKISATAISLDKTSVTLYSNTTPNTTTLTATLTPADSTDSITWTTSDENVATVNNGVVTAVGPGTATITATAGNYSATCTVTVTRKSSGGGGGGGTTTYTVAVDSAKNGSVSVSPKNASKGTTVTITVKPDSGYELDDLTVTDKNGDTVKLTRKSDTQYTFTMPASKVTVEASFTEVEEQQPTPGVDFVDVPADAYYADAVAWAVENGVTNGTSTTTFSPDASCTRAQMVTFLWRAAGSPKATGGNPFTDVSAGAYYYEAVLWAVEQGITNGTSATTFSPDATVTRGQTVTFLWRAGGSPAASGDSFADVAADAYYAPAVQWAVANGITYGTSNTTFSPDEPCTRGQIVTFMYRDAQ